jgi:hypothetical protein
MAGKPKSESFVGPMVFDGKERTVVEVVATKGVKELSALRASYDVSEEIADRVAERARHAG